MQAVRGEALKAATGQGLNFRPDALKAAVGFAEDQKASGRETSETLLALLAEVKADSAQLDVGAIGAAIQSLTEKWSETGSHATVFESIDVFKLPRYQHDFATNQFVPYRCESKAFQGVPQMVDGKTALMRSRFELVKQRLLRDPQFDLGAGNKQDASMQDDESRKPITLTPLGALLGSEGSKCVFGMLSKSERVGLDGDGNMTAQYFLEDLDSKVEVELTLDTESDGGFICEGCCVLADGHFMDGVFQVRPALLLLGLLLLGLLLLPCWGGHSKSVSPGPSALTSDTLRRWRRSPTRRRSRGQ